MRNLLKLVDDAVQRYPDEPHLPISVEVIDTAAGAVERAVAYIMAKGWNEIGIVSDERIYAKFGARLERLCVFAGVAVKLCLVKPDGQGDVVADERSIVQVMVELPLTIQAYFVLGAGTLHDIVRFTASRTGKPFVSVPTAPSVDGFASAGAPILISGFKQTIQTGGPIALFADPDIYCDSPRELVAAGYGDMIGKFTSLFDWKFSHVTAGENYSLAAERLTREALQWCEVAEEGIAAGTPEGTIELMDALILSGLSMLLFGASHPASGAEHHLSHDWEMELLRRGSRQLLHGAKVGVACALIAELYAELASEVEKLGKPELSEALASIPSTASIRERLQRAGGPATPEALGIDRELVEESMRRAHRHRMNRHTLLKWHNEHSARV